MAKFVKVTEAGVKALETLKGQSKELLQYIVNKYGVDKDINQSELVLDLNSHQFDTVVLSKQSTSPISRLYEFYRSKTWSKAGYVVVTSETKGKSGVAAKWKKLEAAHQKLIAHAAYLEDLLEKNNIEYNELVVDEEDEVDTDEEAGEEESEKTI